MRAKESLANLLEITGQGEDAVEIYEALLELNSSDNQGIRYILLPLYVELMMYEEALDLIKEFEEYASTDTLYSHVLVHFLMHGNTKKTRDLLNIAIEHNPYAVDFLSGRKGIPNEEYPYVKFREETEAIVYAQRNAHLWDEARVLFDEM